MEQIRNYQSCLSDVKHKFKLKRHLINQQRLDKECEKMNDKILKITKWERFRERRTQILDKYIKVKRKYF